MVPPEFRIFPWLLIRKPFIIELVALFVMEPDLEIVIEPKFTIQLSFVIRPVSVILAPGSLFIVPEFTIIPKFVRLPVSDIVRLLPIVSESPELRVKLPMTHTKLGSQEPPRFWHEFWSTNVKFVAFAS